LTDSCRDETTAIAAIDRIITTLARRQPVTMLGSFAGRRSNVAVLTPRCTRR